MKDEGEVRMSRRKKLGGLKRSQERERDRDEKRQ